MYERPGTVVLKNGREVFFRRMISTPEMRSDLGIDKYSLLFVSTKIPTKEDLLEILNGLKPGVWNHMTKIVHPGKDNEYILLYLWHKEDDMRQDFSDIEERVVIVEASSGLKKGDTISFDWKQGDKLIPVEGIISKVFMDWKSKNPAQKYLYQIKLSMPVTITMDQGKTLTVKRTSMKNIERELV